jgi:hypothetical protein
MQFVFIVDKNLVETLKREFADALWSPVMEYRKNIKFFSTSYFMY